MCNAHTPNGAGEWQRLEDHLDQVSRLCRPFGEPLGIGDTAALLGAVHDAGKSAPDFQEYLQRCYAADHGGPPAPPLALHGWSI